MKDEMLEALVAEYGAMEPGLPVPDLMGYANRMGLDFHGFASMARIQAACLEYYRALQREEAEREAAAARAACRCCCCAGAASPREDVTPVSAAGAVARST